MTDNEFNEKLGLLWPQLRIKMMEAVIKTASESKELAVAGALVSAGSAMIERLDKEQGVGFDMKRPSAPKLKQHNPHA